MDLPAPAKGHTVVSHENLLTADHCDSIPLTTTYAVALNVDPLHGVAVNPFLGAGDVVVLYDTVAGTGTLVELQGRPCGILKRVGYNANFTRRISHYAEVAL